MYIVISDTQVGDCYALQAFGFVTRNGNYDICLIHVSGCFFLLQVKAILNTLEEAGIQIGEDPVFEKGFRPGINYDRPNRIGERKRPEDVQII